MKIILTSRRDRYLAKFSIFLITVALVAGMAGCTLDQYSLTISSTEGGEVIVPEEETLTCYDGQPIQLYAEADHGYRFVEWTGDVDTIVNAKDASTTIKVAGNYSITATFEEIPEYNLTISSTAGGNVTTPGEGNFTDKGGTKVALVATRDVGWGFVNWTGDISDIADVNAATTTITMNGNYSITANFEEEEAVTFADDNLKAAIIAAIIEDEDIVIPEPDRDDFYPSDLKGLDVLHAEEWNVSDLTGLEHCTSLERLYLKDNQIDDLSTLAHLTGLTELSIGGNQISGVPPLANLASLTEFNLDHNQISDISLLANLTGLTELSLEGNQISDISSLANLTSLRDLRLGSNNISDISLLANLTSLNYLRLGSNNISDISPLANLTSLDYLYLEGNQISDISPLANLTSLDYLRLGSNNISDISPLANLTSLNYLRLENNNISDISPLAELAKLTKLYLWSNNISDISPLANLTKLEKLDLSDNKIRNIEPLFNNTGLSDGDEVDLRNNYLNYISKNTYYIDQLEARGVEVLS